METNRAFPRSIEALDAVFAFLDESLPRGIDEKTSFCVQLAVEEVFTNMVRHNEAGGGEISIAVAVEPEEIRLRLLDHDVEPFDPNSVSPPDLTLPVRERQPGGLGLHFVRAVVDRVVYEYVDRTMLVTLVKNLVPIDVSDRG